MGTLSVIHPTLLDVTKRLSPLGRVDTIAEMLHQTNEPLGYLTQVEGNLLTGHRSTIRTGLPLPTWRKLYGGVQPTKSTTAQVTGTCGMLEAYAEVDKALADLNGNTAAFRLSEDTAHIEGVSQEYMSTLIYGNEGTEPEAFTGLTTHYNSKSAENGINIITGGSDANQNNTSVWLIVSGINTIFGIYPKGSIGGLQMTDKGQVTVENANDVVGGAVGGGRFEAYRTHYRWDCGLMVRDWRFGVRISDLKTTANAITIAGSGSGVDANLTDLMAQATELIPSLSAGRAFFMANRKIKSLLRRQLAEKVKASTLSMDMVGGKHVLTFDGIPVLRCDAILNTEDRAAA